LASEEKVEAYLAGKLSEPEANRFEDHYILCPDCIDLLESTDRFIRSVRAAGEILQGSVVSRLGPRRAAAGSERDR
jgi:hypothetical protein